jgi:vacuolar protein sorting-associated protein 54
MADSRTAISTLLQPPIVRTGLLPHTSGPNAPKPPTTRDIPPVTLPTIPNVDNNVFKSYLSQAGVLYEVFRQAKEEGDDSRPPSSRRSSRAGDTTAEGLPHGMSRRLSAASGISRLDPASPDESTPQLRRRSSGGVARRSALTVAPLSTIPNVYFEPDFHLENPRTFDVVSERSEIARPNGAPTSAAHTEKKALAANAILQEKLSWYMDTVEIHLISSISTASTSFFAALGSLRELHSEAAESVAKIKAVRKDLADLDDSMAVGGLKIVEKRRRRGNLRKLGNAVQQLEMITNAVTKCEEQIDSGHLDESLDGIAEVESLIKGQGDSSSGRLVPQSPSSQRMPLIDLRGIRALDGAAGDIAFLRRRIGNAYEGKFLETLLSDLRGHVDKVPSKTTFQRWNNASNRLRGQNVRTSTEVPAYLHVDEGFRTTLRSHLKGLARSESLMTAAATYREAVLKEVKNLIRRHLPSSTDDDAGSTTSIMTQESRSLSAGEKSSILARNLRNLEAEDAEEMFKKIYSNVGEALRRLGTQVKLLLDITSSLENPAYFKSPPGTPRSESLNVLASPTVTTPTVIPIVRQEEIQQALDLSSLLGQAVDIAQNQINKVLKVRTEQTTRLEVPFFLHYFTLNRLFADECEAVSGRGGSALKNVVHDHIKTFVSVNAELERQKLVQKMDADKWEARDFTEDDSLRLTHIMDASTKEVEQWTNLKLLWETDTQTNNSTSQNGVSRNGATEGPAKVRSAIIDEAKFILVESAIVAQGGIETFEKLLTGIPSMGSEITTALLEYLKLFNSRAQQLILGAGATKSAGLKNINTRHLALSCQALSFMVAVIPYVREYARRHLPASSALLTEFDKVKRTLQEHQYNIHGKMVDIMTGRATSHVSAMKKVDWDADSSSDAANAYMETLVKETTTLHKVLARHLSEDAVTMIMVPVTGNFKDQFSKAFNAAVVRTPAGKERYVLRQRSSSATIG